MDVPRRVCRRAGPITHPFFPMNADERSSMHVGAMGQSQMHILVHDYCGHPFQVALSRRLAHRGARVTHAWFQDDAGPKGELKSQAGDSNTLAFEPVRIDQPYSKTNFIRRRQGDIAYGRAVARRIQTLQPDIVISGNTPTEAQDPIIKACKEGGSAFVYWCQDFYSIAATKLLSRKVPVIGHGVGAFYRRLERNQMRTADHLVVITDRFLDQTDAWQIPRDKISVIPNWGPIEEIGCGAKDNPWAKRHGLGGEKTFLYTGTLALKHNPELLAEVARAGLGRVVVVAEGVGVRQLQDLKDRQNLKNLSTLPLQPFGELADVLASADVLLAMIERQAAEFSVPSKVLSYLCAGRPIVLAAPEDNLAARIVTDAGAGTVVAPEDKRGFVEAAAAYIRKPEAARQAGNAGRTYASENFDLETIAEQFETVIDKAIARKKSTTNAYSNR